MTYLHKCRVYNMFQFDAWTDMDTLYQQGGDGKWYPISAEEAVGTEYLRLESGCDRVPFSLDGKYGFFDAATGRVAVRPEWDFVGEFDIKTGLAPVYLIVTQPVDDPLYSAPPTPCYCGKVDVHGRLQGKLIWQD